ncbi:MAG TPA: hypothetical protein VM099_10520 [Gemmatimonadaceae bacterium]|nr:hypothetical protein [Gemmatimonadaceae bacterium]
MISRVLFLSFFVVGLAVGVYAMLHGIERRSKKRRPSAIFNTPVVAALAVVFGAAGYLLDTRTGLSAPAILVIAGVVAIAITIGAIALISRWALPYAGAPTSDDTAQGTIAIVTRTISASNAGEISYETDGITRTIAAESLLGTQIPVHSEVVIDTIDGGIARVESWSSVEQRL